jgi:Asp-tRNA(Asn)/Glu-tRNA(Gln) amidotransferase A subunit family amidase
MIGRTNLDAFAHGGSTENSYFGPTSNAYDKSRVAGGSSGGSAVAVALDIVPFALGSDTGGSIRQPASFNGVYGIKPTYGTVSRYGVVAMASSTDTMGCFAKNAEDVNLVMDIMAGKDEKDSTTLEKFWKDDLPDPKGKKIGIITDFMGDGVDKEVVECVKKYAEKLKKAARRLGYTNNMLERILISRCEIDMHLIREYYENTFHLSLNDDIGCDTYGYHRKFLTALSQKIGFKENQNYDLKGVKEI